ncbi:TPA: hypothetical protein ACPZB8_001817 [Yersinia enterocolitica]
MSTGDSQLLPVLSNASDSELAPLVEYITKAFSSGIESKARYKTHCPAHSQYADLIARAVRVWRKYRRQSVSRRWP